MVSLQETSNLNAFEDKYLLMQRYFTIEAAVLSENGKISLPAYKKVFSASEKGFVSETHENLRCLKNLSENFNSTCSCFPA